MIFYSLVRWGVALNGLASAAATTSQTIAAADTPESTEASTAMTSGDGETAQATMTGDPSGAVRLCLSLLLETPVAQI